MEKADLRGFAFFWKIPPAFGRKVSIRPARARGGAPEADALPGTKALPRRGPMARLSR